MATEEASLDDLFMLLASEASQELHKLKILAHKIREAKEGNEKVEDEILQVMAEADVIRAMRQQNEREFLGIPDNFPVEKKRRTRIGEEGCDFKHCLINFMHNFELAQKYLRLMSEAEEKGDADKVNYYKKKVMRRLRAAMIYKDMAFNIRDFIMSEIKAVENKEEGVVVNA